jgi:hypothetical protein
MDLVAYIYLTLSKFNRTIFSVAPVKVMTALVILLTAMEGIIPIPGFLQSVFHQCGIIHEMKHAMYR